LHESRTADDAQAPGSDAERYGFSRFASHPFFDEVNRWLVDRVASLGSRFVDLACGPGAVTELILQAMRERSRGLVYAVDPSFTELDRARRRITSGVVKFVQGSAENLSRLVPTVDVVVFCNAIHLIKDKGQVLGEIRKVLRAGGTLAFNTTFFKGCYPEGTERFYRYWILRAAQYLRERGISALRSDKTDALQWVTPEEYGTLVARAGFVEPTWRLHEVTLSPESLEDIGQFSLFVHGALPEVPLAIGADALAQAVRRAMDDAKIQGGVPRFWLQFIARAPASVTP
jgi:ubiquinone/menaquinone biosynthesis C-methylase UbiE